MQIAARNLKVGDLFHDCEVTHVARSAGGAVIYAWVGAPRHERPADLIFNHGDPVVIERPTTRSYTVGAPITVTVHEDGKVTYEVDLSEIHDIWESENDYDEAQIEADSATIDAATTAHYAANRNTTQEV